MFNEALAVIQRSDAVRLDGVHLGQQGGQSVGQQPSRRCLQLRKVPPEGLAGLTRTSPNLQSKEKVLRHLKH